MKINFKKTAWFTAMPLCLVMMGLFIAYGCEKTKLPPDDSGSSIFNPTAITPVLVSKEHYFASYTPSNTQQELVIKTATEWKNLISNIYDYALEDFFVDTADRNINFSKYQVITVIDTLKSQCYCSIDITDITEYTDKIIVTYTNLDTTITRLAIVSQPYHIVKIPVSKKNVIFDYDEEKKGEKGL